jgi:serine/threonine-protein kinase
VLAAFRSGDLSDDSFELVARHVEECADCVAVLQDFPSLDAIGEAALGTPRQLDTFAEEPQCRRPIRSAIIRLRESPELIIEESAKATATADHEKPTLDDVTPTSNDQSARPLPAIPGYRVLRRLGGGGMGDVYEAVNVLERHFALKVIRPDRASPEFNARFRKEAATLQDLNHPHVVRIFEYNETGGVPFFTMRLLTGGTLASRMAEFQASSRKAAALVGQVAEALAYLHRRGILHRDLKPPNIMFDDEDRPIITDFGLTKELTGRSSEPPLLQTPEPPGNDVANTPAVTEEKSTTPAALTINGRLGTLAYMSPEQVRGNPAEIDARTDIWALGIVFYELLMGYRPFSAANNADIERQILTADPQWPQSVPDLKPIVLKCLEKDPHNRYATAADLAKDLRAWALANTSSAHAPADIGHLQRLTKTLSRHPLVTAVVAASILLASVLAIFWIKDKSKSGAPASPGSIELIGKSGLAVPYRWPCGPADLSTPEASVVRVKADDRRLLQLLETVPWESYRFEAEVLDQSLEPGEIGIYIAHVEQPVEKYLEHWLCALTFAEAELIPGANPAKPKEGKCTFTPLGLRDPSSTLQLDVAMNQRLFDVEQGRWRKLMIEIDSTSVTATWHKDEDPFCRVVRGKIEKDMVKQLNELLATGLARISSRPTLDWTGGLGLYCRQGTALFRNVKVEAITNADRKANE